MYELVLTYKRQTVDAPESCEVSDFRFLERGGQSWLWFTDVIGRRFLIAADQIATLRVEDKQALSPALPVDADRQPAATDPGSRSSDPSSCA